VTAFLQTDEGGWSYDIPEREEDDTPDLDRSAFANRARIETLGRYPCLPTNRNGEAR
jgi:hypothetical protein